MSGWVGGGGGFIWSEVTRWQRISNLSKDEHKDLRCNWNVGNVLTFPLGCLAVDLDVV